MAIWKESLPNPKIIFTTSPCLVQYQIIEGGVDGSKKMEEEENLSLNIPWATKKHLPRLFSF